MLDRLPNRPDQVLPSRADPHRGLNPKPSDHIVYGVNVFFFENAGERHGHTE